MLSRWLTKLMLCLFLWCVKTYQELNLSKSHMSLIYSLLLLIVKLSLKENAFVLIRNELIDRQRLMGKWKQVFFLIKMIFQKDVWSWIIIWVGRLFLLKCLYLYVHMCEMYPCDDVTLRCSNMVIACVLIGCLCDCPILENVSIMLR